MTRCVASQEVDIAAGAVMVVAVPDGGEVCTVTASAAVDLGWSDTPAGATILYFQLATRNLNNQLRPSNRAFLVIKSTGPALKALVAWYPYPGGGGCSGSCSCGR